MLEFRQHLRLEPQELDSPSVDSELQWDLQPFPRLGQHAYHRYRQWHHGPADLIQDRQAELGRLDLCARFHDQTLAEDHLPIHKRGVTVAQPMMLAQALP